MITLNNVGKDFNGKWAVRDLTLTVRRGEIFALLGPNAAGKTTTIKMMTGLLKPTEGNILINGHDIVNDPLPAKATFGYVPDKSYLYDKLTAAEFLFFISSLHNIVRKEAARRIEGLVDIVGIRENLDEMVGNFSHGMRQRLVFASALVHEPEVLIIDEPFVGLDPYGVIMLKGLLNDLREKGVTIFLATHSLHIAEELCDNAGILQEGSLITIKNREDITGVKGGLEALFLEATS